MKSLLEFVQILKIIQKTVKILMKIRLINQLDQSQYFTEDVFEIVRSVMWKIAVAKLTGKLLIRDEGPIFTCARMTPERRINEKFS